MSILNLPPSPEIAARRKQFADAITRGEAALKAGDNDGALAAFRQAYAIEPDDGLVLIRLAEAYTAKGQDDQALAAYRTLLVRAPGRKWASSAEADPTVLAKFGLLTLRHGQGQEALAAYERAIGVLNYDGGKPNQDVLLPDLGPGGPPPPPQLLTAMLHLVLGLDTPGYDGGHLREAVRLAPDSAAAHYYLGKYLDGRDSKGARSELQQATRLGDQATAAAADKYLKCIH